MNELTPGSIPVGDTGKNLDTTVVTTTEGDVHREAVFVADPTNPDARANVVQSHADLEDFALLVKSDDGVTDLMQGILFELKLLNVRFEEAFRTNITDGDVPHDY